MAPAMKLMASLLALTSCVVLANGACIASTLTGFTCQQAIGKVAVIHWRPISNGLRMAVVAPGNVWTSLMVPSVPGFMTTNDPLATPALDSPKPSYAVVGLAGVGVRSYEQNGVYHATPILTNKTYATFRAPVNGIIGGTTFAVTATQSIMTFDMLHNPRLPCTTPTTGYNLLVSRGLSSAFAYHGTNRAAFKFKPYATGKCIA